MATPRPDDAAPQRARYDAAIDELRLLGPCSMASVNPSSSGGGTLVLRVGARDGLPLASRSGAAPVHRVGLARRRSDHPRRRAFRSLVGAPRAGSTFDLTTAIPIEPVEDEVRPVRRRDARSLIDITALQEALRKNLRGLSGAAVLTTTTSFLADRIGAEIEYQFR